MKKQILLCLLFTAMGIFLPIACAEQSKDAERKVKAGQKRAAFRAKKGLKIKLPKRVPDEDFICLPDGLLSEEQLLSLGIYLKKNRQMTDDERNSVKAKNSFSNIGGLILSIAVWQGNSEALADILKQTSYTANILNRQINFSSFPPELCSFQNYIKEGNALEVAKKFDRRECIEILLKFGATDQSVAAISLTQKENEIFDLLFAAVRNNDTEGVDLFMEKAAQWGDDVGIDCAPIFLVADEQFGDTPLIIASRLGHTAMVKKLLDVGADPALKNGKNFDKDDALAVAKNDEIRLLLLAVQAKQ